MPKSYRWKKVWAVQTAFEDEVKVGDLIEVGSNGGDSSQRVVSTTVMENQAGDPYKVLLTQEVK